MYADQRGLTNPAARISVFSLYTYESFSMISENHINVLPTNKEVIKTKTKLPLWQYSCTKNYHYVSSLVKFVNSEIRHINRNSETMMVPTTHAILQGRCTIPHNSSSPWMQIRQLMNHEHFLHLRVFSSVNYTLPPSIQMNLSSHSIYK